MCSWTQPVEGCWCLKTSTNCWLQLLNYINAEKDCVPTTKETTPFFWLWSRYLLLEPWMNLQAVSTTVWVMDTVSDPSTSRQVICSICGSPDRIRASITCTLQTLPQKVYSGTLIANKKLKRLWPLFYPNLFFFFLKSVALSLLLNTTSLLLNRM